MRKVRQFFQVILFITFMVGLHDGMKAGNLGVIILNALIVLALINSEDSGKDGK